MNIDRFSPFQATWNPNNTFLNPHSGNSFEKLIRKVKNFVCYIPNCIVATCINPRKATPFVPFSYEQNARFFAKQIITPDGVSLNLNIRRAKNPLSSTPTVILFNPLATNDGVHDSFGALLNNHEVNVVTFDYRGLGSTQRAEDFVIDGDSVYQYVSNELKIQKDKIHFYGFSFGGAIAAQVKALHPECTGKFLGDRPFKSVFHFISENCCITRFGSMIKTITTLAAAIFLAYPIYLLGWEWDGTKALSQLKGDVRIIYHPNDCLIPFQASLASLFKNQKEKLISLSSKEFGFSTHFGTLDWQRTEQEEDAQVVALNFLAS